MAKVILPLCSALVRYIWSHHQQVRFGLLRSVPHDNLKVLQSHSVPLIRDSQVSQVVTMVEGPQSVALRRAGYTAAHFKSYRDEPGSPEVIETNRETTVKYPKGIKLQAVQKGQVRKESWGFTVYIKKWIECEELSLKNSHKQVESLWVRLRDQGNKGNLVVGVYHRQPDQGESVGKAFLLQLQETLPLQALILLGDFSHPNICWKSGRMSFRQSMRLLECINDHFLSEVMDSPTTGDAMLHLCYQHKLTGNIKTGDSPGCSDCAPVEFAILRDMGQAKNKVSTLNFRKAIFQEFGTLQGVSH
ncbi:egf-like repeat and discoidin i-like domain-containing protein 3 [Limosa lapponica baueri]|uniref:Egf-like repeat and discoidin i-like domain-containing protein 3 n=1 Tax=Limosa lapponica baueri TaxID=1758121 RepID=A0A2I0U401_LIMLA|nr:egf-like repeat and discoidin i-like domain-containing protein 3 [Limosa lapponica baueri]